jgi:hypothetical protein
MIVRPATKSARRGARTGHLVLLLLVLLPLAGCGDLPRPFMGNPGATARRLAVPPPPRLLVPTPADALLPDAASKQFADALAVALQMNEVPAVADNPREDDWKLIVHAALRQNGVVAVYTVVDPHGKDQGKTEGPPVPTPAWSAATPATLAQVAKASAPGIATLLTRVEAALMQADPNSLYNRTAHVMVAPVTGAPGDGNFSLTAQMRDKLSHLGPIVQDTAEGADFKLAGGVKLVPIGGNQERVEIQWSLADAQGRDLGKVVQLNNVPAGSLNGFWGDVAVVVAEEASGGVEQIIQRVSGHEKRPDEVAGQPATAGGTSATPPAGAAPGAALGTAPGAAPGTVPPPPPAAARK